MCWISHLSPAVGKVSLRRLFLSGFDIFSFSLVLSERYCHLIVLSHRCHAVLVKPDETGTNIPDVFLMLYDSSHDPSKTLYIWRNLCYTSMQIKNYLKLSEVHVSADVGSRWKQTARFSAILRYKRSESSDREKSECIVRPRLWHSS